MRDIFKYRSTYIKITLFVVALVLIFRLVDLQILNNYSSLAYDNALLKKKLYAPRGLIYDRNNKLLVYNANIYDLEIIVKEWDEADDEGEPVDTNRLCELLNITKDELIAKLDYVTSRETNPYYSPLIPQKLITQISPKEAAVIQEVVDMFPGLSINSRTMRRYSTDNAAHALGSIGEISPALLKEKPNEYQQGDYIGVSGVEKQYEEALRGKNGYQIFLRDVKGRIQGKYKDGTQDVAPEEGKALTLSIDIDLQGYGEYLMQNKVGSAVAIEPSTGEILALVSSPGYNLSDLVGKKRGENYNALLHNPYKPLLDRPMMARYPPGSTFKTVNALVFQQEGIINEYTRIPCHSGYVVGSFRLGCHSHASPLDLANSISNSCNAYYCSAFRQMIDNKKYDSRREAFETWKNDIVSFGFGYKLGVDFPNEDRGFIPNAKTYDKIHGENRWRSLNIVSISIGQGEILSTPIQLANLCAVIANRGYWIRPHILKNMKGEELDTAYTNKQYCAVEEKYFEPVIRGMQWAVNGGGSGSTARIARLNSIVVCGKTGTSENPHGENHSIFIAFAPKDNPKIAIAVIVENAGFGSTYAAPIASLMIEKYLNDSIAENRMWLEKRMADANILPKIKR